jgi:hypothetical protein
VAFELGLFTTPSERTPVAIEAVAEASAATAGLAAAPAAIEATTTASTPAEAEAVADAESPPADAILGKAPAPPIAQGEARGRAREARTDFDEVMHRASTRVRICLVQAGLKTGTRVRFDIAVEARTGRISAASPRDPHRDHAGLGACVVEAARGAAVRPPPANEWRRSYEFTS